MGDRGLSLPNVTKPIPEGWHSVTPRLVVHDPARLVEFLKQAFDATGDFRTDIATHNNERH